MSDTSIPLGIRSGSAGWLTRCLELRRIWRGSSSSSRVTRCLAPRRGTSTRPRLRKPPTRADAALRLAGSRERGVWHLDLGLDGNEVSWERGVWHLDSGTDRLVASTEPLARQRRGTGVSGISKSITRCLAPRSWHHLESPQHLEVAPRMWRRDRGLDTTAVSGEAQSASGEATFSRAERPAAFNSGHGAPGARQVADTAPA